MTLAGKKTKLEEEGEDYEEKTRVTRRRVPSKWRKIYRNSLVTISRFDLENGGQGHRVRLSQWFHSMANIKIDIIIMIIIIIIITIIIIIIIIIIISIS